MIARSHILFRAFLFFIILIWTAGFSSLHLLPADTFSAGSFFIIKQMYSNVCHQLPERCIEWNGWTFLVCARCTGIYAGAAAASLFSLIINKRIIISRKLMIFALLPMLIDVILYSAGVYQYSKSSAFISGLFSGSAVFLYILFILENFLDELKIKHESK